MSTTESDSSSSQSANLSDSEAVEQISDNSDSALYTNLKKNQLSKVNT